MVRWWIVYYARKSSHIKIKSFIGTSKNAAMTQIWIALCVYLHLAFIKFQSKLNKRCPDDAYYQRMAAGLYEARSLDQNAYMTLLFAACHPKIAYCCQQRRIPCPAIEEDARILDSLHNSQGSSDDSFADWVNKNNFFA